jgi:hypothetical protein
MDRFLGEVKIERPAPRAPARHVPVTHAPVANAPVANTIADAPGGKAAQASSRAKAAVLIACVLLGAYFYAAQEKKNAATAHAVQETLEQLAAGPADAAAVQGRVFHDRQGNVYCGELGGHNARGAELRLKDGMRLFVCGPGPRAGGPPPR